MNSYLLVTNAAAGSNEESAVAAATAVLERHGAVEVAATSEPSELDDVLRGVDGRTVVVAGGDGSLHAVVNALHRLGLLDDATVGLVPLGTGNDFARGSGIPLDPAEAAAVIAGAPAVPIDLVLDSDDRVVVNNVHLGVGAEASRAGAAWKPRLGRFGYAVGALVAGLRPAFTRVRVVVDDRPVYSGHVTQVAIGNGSHVGGGTELVPGAEPASGDLVVIVSRELRLGARLAYLARLRRGLHHQMREVTRVTGRKVSVSGEEFWLSTDGEISGPYRSMTWSLLPATLRMHLPG